MPSIADQHLVVLGGTSGFGFATAKATLAEGARVTIASRSAEKLSGALVRLGNRASGQCVDVTDKPMLERFLVALGSFDHLAVTVGDPLLNKQNGAHRRRGALGFRSPVLGSVQRRPRGLPAYQQIGLDYPGLRPCRAARARAGYLCRRAWRD
jgi:NAD(P)-dependent dehydrogenase (short-subunit alcohol dehydrogenase family)